MVQVLSAFLSANDCFRWSSSGSIGRRSGLYSSNFNFSNAAPLTKTNKDYSDFSSNSSLESGRRSREQSSSREHFLSSYDSNDGPFGPKTENLHSWRSKFAAESRNQQSPTINILQIKLEGGNTRSQCGPASQQGLRQQGHQAAKSSSDECCETCVGGGDPSSSHQQKDVLEKKSHQRSASTQPVSSSSKQPVAGNHAPVSPNGNKSSGSSQEKIGQQKPKTSPNPSRPTVNPREIEKLTSDVDVQKKRQRFEGAGAARNGSKTEKPRSQPEVPPRRRSVKQNWQQVREKHCPVTNQIVNEGNGESLRNSILVSEEKVSFRNIKFKKATHVTVGGEEIKLKEVTSTKAFEDRATAILTEMRKQRRTLQLEYVAKVKHSSVSFQLV